VIDILDFHVYGYHWPAFKLTDSAIVNGVTLLMFYEFFKTPKLKDLKEKNSGR